MEEILIIDDSPTFRDALETQYVCDSVLKSGKTGQWEKVARLK